MTNDSIPVTPSLEAGEKDDLARFRDAGHRLAQSIRSVTTKGNQKTQSPSIKARRKALRAAIAKAAAAGRSDEQQQYIKWLLDNARLVYASEQQTREFVLDPSLPVVTDESGNQTLRTSLIAREYLRQTGNGYRDDSFLAFLGGFQQVSILSMAEGWGLRPALQLELINRITDSAASEWPGVITSLRLIAETSWKELFEAASVTNRILISDPAATFARMDFESRENYRTVIGNLAKYSALAEHEIAAAAIEFAKQAAAVSDGSRAAIRRTHVGFYLVDKGLPTLEAAAQY
ncbi:MAG: hypothetical protein WBW33_29475, partial [Bryobacteraceae bacterium]